MKNWEIRYYNSEAAKRTGAPMFKETIRGDKNYVENWAQNKLRQNPNFKCYEIIEK